MKEEWKDIKGYESLYKISNLGRIRNNHGKILCPSTAMHGYLRIGLRKQGVVRYAYIHRLVAEEFVENPFGYKEVNHIDEDKQNNVAENLEWVSRLYNTNYGNRPRKTGRYAKIHNGNTVYQYDRNNVLVNEFRSLREAEKLTGFCRQFISKYLDTGIPYKGFLWKR